VLAVARVDDVRVFRGIYGGFALAMSEAEEGARFRSMPSSDEMASKARDLSRQVIIDDRREDMPGAQQELISMAVSLALIGHGGEAERLNAEPVAETLSRLVSLVDGREAAVPARAR
jgi:hypothetical protein